MTWVIDNLLLGPRFRSSALEKLNTFSPVLPL